MYIYWDKRTCGWELFKFVFLKFVVLIYRRRRAASVDCNSTCGKPDRQWYNANFVTVSEYRENLRCKNSVSQIYTFVFLILYRLWSLLGAFVSFGRIRSRWTEPNEKAIDPSRRYRCTVWRRLQHSSHPNGLFPAILCSSRKVCVWAVHQGWYF